MHVNRSRSMLFRSGVGILGLIFVSMGLIVLLSVTGHLSITHAFAFWEEIAAWLASGVFLFAGLGLLSFGIGKNLVAAKLGGLSLLFFLLTFNWIAFGPGERHFTRAISFGASGTSSTISEGEGRAVFGVVAGGLDLLIVYSFIRAKQRKL